MNAADAVAALAERRIVDAPAVLLVAHPDDEVLGASVALGLHRDLLLLHATDGAKGADAVGGSAARFAELEGALVALGVAPRLARIDLPDGALDERADVLAAALAPMIAGAQVAITHAFEGGHPDHDACALAMQLACGKYPRAPARLEFAVYAREGDRLITNSFGDRPDPVPARLRLSPDEVTRKRAALAAFASQRHVVSRFPVAEEQIRPSPVHDFAARRDPARVLFARGDAAVERAWRDVAAAAIARAG